MKTKYFGLVFLLTGICVCFQFAFAGQHKMVDLADWSQNGMFKRNAGYSELIKLNISMHKEAANLVAEEITRWQCETGLMQISFLDLGSGTDTPVVSHHIFQALEEAKVSIDYTAIDINEKLGDVRAFDFPKNVVKQNIIVGDAYHLRDQAIADKQYSVLYAGLNLHHLGAREMVKVLQDYKKMLQAKGIFVIFDVVHPEDEPYVAKPKDQVMIDPQLLAHIPEPEFLVGAHITPDENWRNAFANTYGEYAASRNVNAETITETKSHILANDYPFSLTELAKLLKANGFMVEEFPFAKLHPNVPVSKYFGVLIARHIEQR